MKDNDFRGWKAKIRLRADEVGALLEQLVKDGKFLSEIYKVMDYSLLGEFFLISYHINSNHVCCVDSASWCLQETDKV